MTMVFFFIFAMCVEKIRLLTGSFCDKQQQLATVGAAQHPQSGSQHTSVAVLDRRPVRSGTGGADGGTHDRSIAGGEPQVAVNAKLIAFAGAGTSSYSQYGSYMLGERVRKLTAVKVGSGDAEKENVGRGKSVSASSQAYARGPAAKPHANLDPRAARGLRGEDHLPQLIQQLGLSRETLDLVLPARQRVNQ